MVAPVIALLVIALVSLLAVRVGSTALMMTGISWDTASFQAYSAFFGVGFTTKEAELVVNHPVRRRIIRDLILAGNVGLTSALATLIVTLLQSGSGGNTVLMLGGLIGGLIVMLFISRLAWFQKVLDHVIRHTLERTGMVRALDYELLLRIQHGYVVSEIEVLPDTFLAGRSLRESRPWDRGVVILAIKRDSETIPGIPCRDDLIQAGDVLTAYGKETALQAMTQPLEKRKHENTEP
ncbi:TrkA C-terminal domain-containing protein [Prosthecobacter sp.]|uniref:cation:proton antiporter regulatory subunit n=1 Tax=Prosthecobacter sp. TaxID=1965333 RepID=UPI0024885A5A|nr:TrkA C-terminal domain-containing protein [Prosthecobacter sp.]MDI1311112.1 TrkA C-terminal domain-containing protein [Prosthecobacter sp.]